MSHLNFFGFAYLGLPVIGILADHYLKVLPRGPFSLYLSVLRVLVLVVLMVGLIREGQTLDVDIKIIDAISLTFLFRFTALNCLLLLVTDSCFLLSNFLNGRIVNDDVGYFSLRSLVQLCLTAFLISENVIVIGASVILLGTILYFLFNWGEEPRAKNFASQVANWCQIIFFFFGILFLAWGVLEFGDKRLLLQEVHGTFLSKALWILALLVFSPSLFWARWYDRMVLMLPGASFLILTTVISIVLFKFVTLVHVVYPATGAGLKAILGAIGFVSCFFSILGLNVSKEPLRFFMRLPLFFWSLLIFSAGVGSDSISSGSAFLVILTPIVCALLVLLASLESSGSASSVFRLFFAGVMVCFPGSPLYLIFASIGSSCLSLGMAYSISFLIIGIFYIKGTLEVIKIFNNQGFVSAGFFVDNRLKFQSYMQSLLGIGILAGSCLAIYLAGRMA